MAKKEFKYRGKTLDELKKLSVKEFSELIPSRQRRSLKRGLPDEHKDILKSIKDNKKNIKTHIRNMVVLPEMVGATLKVYNGKDFIMVIIQDEMIGHFLGEFTYNRKRIAHSAPGIGATRSSSALSVR